ncbi:MAG: DNA gyrase/topoisomerase IV subunit A [Cryomorphaceae bacterium]|nr:DNA gyrase/topoisomerase IV subunit A [Cryomorphaceae bacterium]
MAEEQENPQLPEESNNRTSITRVSGMYEDYFLDYASYVILERAVPALSDGVKPVQRRLLHAMREMDDGRYHKVANIIGQTMKYHPHGDASIGDALVQLGQKELLIDCQGNWGNILTGDSAAAPRYIEARLTKFALEVAFNAKITEWSASYDGRGKEPVFLPMKFPLLLAQGVEGIAVGLSTKVLPHNFNELIDASINILKGKKVTVVPDFPSGGIADVSNYNDGIRGGRVRVRAKIEALDKKTLIIKEVPFGTTTTSLIESVIKANDKGKIKIKKIEDNTSEFVEILVHLAPNISPDKTIDALYAFTDCEVSISPLACVIENDRPIFVGVTELLRLSTEHTVDLTRQELQVKLDEYQNDWHAASLERIFIENRIYRDIEEAETWEQVLQFIHDGLKPHIGHLLRPVTDEDVARLTEIRIKRISKYDSDKANDNILALEGKIAEYKHHLENLVEYTINYFKHLKEKYGKDKGRKTEIRMFDDIVAQKVAIANEKLYVNREEGFVGIGLKKAEYVCDCSDIDDIIVFRSDGVMMVSKVDQKMYMGKDIIHVGVFKKGDKRKIFHFIYSDGPNGPTYMKRFFVDGVTRDREYDLTNGTKGSKVLYFSVNPNGESETVTVHHRAIKKVKKMRFDLDLGELAIKGRGVKGNTVTKHPVKKIERKEKGSSTLAPRRIWLDETVMRLNGEGRGRLLGRFSGDDRILEITTKGQYRLLPYDFSTHFEEDWLIIEKYDPEKPVSTIYWEPEKERFYVKRFIPEMSDKKEIFISEEEGAYMEMVSYHPKPTVLLQFKKVKGKAADDETIDLESFISVKGQKAMGNQLTRNPVKNMILNEPELEPEATEEVESEKVDVPETEDAPEQKKSEQEPKDKSGDNEKGSAGIQISLFDEPEP